MGRRKDAAARAAGTVWSILGPILFAATSAAASLALVLQPARPQPVPPVHEEEEAEISADGGLISPYDDIFRRVGADYHIDWRLLCAIAAVESRFDPAAISPRGATGLMQVMPYVAQGYGAEAEELFEPERNIEIAAQIIRYNDRQLPRDIGGSDRLAMLVASYNSGFGHVADARSLALYYDDDPSLWEDVAEYLELLADEDFFDHDAVSFGQFEGAAETVGYVDKVLKRYARYCRIADEV